ncbi:hypothetical protein V5O48_014308 [Marasmius crinis-equi]|uniref:Uncharacterized protein n=1 Tax=Marasmius crinis-equi TaxID=585013 RepID=A0ABR3EXP7_9AGAR
MDEKDRQILELINKTDGDVYDMDWKTLGSEYFPGRRHDRLERRATRLIKDIAKGRGRNLASCVGRRSGTESDSSSTVDPADTASSHTTTSDRSAEFAAESHSRPETIPHDETPIPCRQGAVSVQSNGAFDHATIPCQDIATSSNAYYDYDSIPPRQDTMSVQNNDAYGHNIIPHQGVELSSNVYCDYDSVRPRQDMMSVQNNDAYGHTTIPHQDRAMTNDAYYDYDSIPPRQDTMSVQNNYAYGHTTIPRQDVELSSNAYCDYRSIPPRQDTVGSQSDAPRANYTPVPRQQDACARVQGNELYVHEYPSIPRRQDARRLQPSDTRGVPNAQGRSSPWRLMRRPADGDRPEQRMSSSFPSFPQGLKYSDFRS